MSGGAPGGRDPGDRRSTPAADALAPAPVPGAAPSFPDDATLEPTGDIAATDALAFGRELPAKIGEYQVVRRIEGGGMADVYVANKQGHHGFIRRALIKRVKRARPGFQNLQRMLLDEARATSCFDHPNIVSLLDVGEDEQGIFIALEFVDGTDLRWVNEKLRARKEALPFELACYIVGEILRGLHHAHRARGPDGLPLEIVHRDVNPANVLIAHTGHVKLADFGVVRMRDRLQQQTEVGLVKGKYAYLAPEYIAGESCSLQTDIYATGVMLFELLCGRECFSGATAYEVMWKIVKRGVPLYRLEREGVPEDLSRIVHRAVNPVPERRYESAQEMANALETWLMRSGKHATSWVLSVFFERHGLYPPRGELARALPPPRRVPTPRPDDSNPRIPFESPVALEAPSVPAVTPEVPARPQVVTDSAPGERPPPGLRLPVPAPLAFTSEKDAPAPVGAAALAPAGGRAEATPGAVNIEPPALSAIEAAEASAEALENADMALLESSGEFPILPVEEEAAPISVDAFVAGAPPSLGAGAANAEGEATAAEDASLHGSWAEEVDTGIQAGDAPARLEREASERRAGALTVRLSEGSKREPDGILLADLKIEDPVEATIPPARTPIDKTKTPIPELIMAPPPPPDAPPGAAQWSAKLEDIPGTEALARLAKTGATGRLEFKCGLIWKRVHLDGGAPIGITSNMGMELIGEHLVKARILTRRELDSALHAAEASRGPLTAKLLELGLVDRVTLEEELGRNLAARLAEVLEWRWGTFEFTPEPAEPATLRPKLDLDALITQATAQRAAHAATEPPPEEAPGGEESPESKLQEALKRARTIAESTGKGRVDDLGGGGRR